MRAGRAHGGGALPPPQPGGVGDRGAGGVHGALYFGRLQRSQNALVEAAHDRRLSQAKWETVERQWFTI